MVLEINKFVTSDWALRASQGQLRRWWRARDEREEKCNLGNDVPKIAKGIILLTDSHTNKIISISLWETQAYMKASETSGYLQQQIGQVAPSLAAPPVREAYEVSVHI